MGKRLNKTSICSVVFLDIVKYSELSIHDQGEVKKHFDFLITESLKNTPQNDRIILDTGDGAAIAFLGAPEDAMFFSLNMRNSILSENKLDIPLNVRFGINLGPVRIINDINGHLNIIGDGINVAQRIMSFAAINQILVTRSYYEVTSRLSKEFTEIFTYSGLRKDKHIREHELYEIKHSLDINFHHLETYSDNTVAMQFKPLQSSLISGYTPYGLLIGLATFIFLLAAFHDQKSTRNPTLSVQPEGASVLSPSPKSKAEGDSSLLKEHQRDNSLEPIAESNATLTKTTPSKKSKSLTSAPSQKVRSQHAKSKYQASKQTEQRPSSEKFENNEECSQGEIALFQCR